MKFLKSFPILIILLFSCSQKAQKISIQKDFTPKLEPLNSSKKINNLPLFANDANFNQLLKENKLAFVVFGIVADDYSAFEKKYGIKVKTENCVVMPNISKLASKNNLIIEKYLNQKFQHNWKSDLKFIPFGIN